MWGGVGPLLLPPPPDPQDRTGGPGPGGQSASSRDPGPLPGELSPCGALRWAAQPHGEPAEPDSEAMSHSRRSPKAL